MAVLWISAPMLVGAGLALAAIRSPNHHAELERWGGLLLIGGLALLGVALGRFCWNVN